MKKNIVVFWGIFLLLSLIQLCSHVISADDPVNPVWIDENKNGVYDDGEWNGTSIQSAINNAVVGDIIHVGAGTYYENIQIVSFGTDNPPEGLTLLGENKDTTIIDGRGDRCVYIRYSRYITLSNFTFKNATSGNYEGVTHSSSWHGTIQDCIFTQNRMGFEASGQVNNQYLVVRRCNFTDNSQYGVFTGAYGANVYHCNFINNGDNAWTRDQNYYDDGYPSGGNYWDDYDGVDEFSGFNQNIPGGDGIGDTPYLVAAGYPVYDNYPLMNPWGWAPPETPVLLNPYPPNQSECLYLSLSVWNITILDLNGDTFNWSIITVPDVGSSSGTDDTNGSKSISISGLVYSQRYYVYVSARSTGDWVNRTYWFKTRQSLRFCGIEAPPPAKKSLPPSPPYTTPLETEDGSDGNQVPGTPGFDMVLFTVAVVAIMGFLRYRKK